MNSAGPIIIPAPHADQAAFLAIHARINAAPLLPPRFAGEYTSQTLVTPIAAH
jgi:hypothetical protein